LRCFTTARKPITGKHIKTVGIQTLKETEHKERINENAQLKLKDTLN
jgi:hypothetical protein